VGAGLSANELETYREQGFLVRERVLPEADLVPLREAVEGIHERVCREAQAGGGGELEYVDDKRYEKLCDSTVKWEWDEGSREIRSMEPFHHLDARIDALIDDPRLWAPLLGLLGCERLSLFTDKLNFKRPGGSPFPWHQDSPYWAFGCSHLDRLTSLQLYLDDASVVNGCLWMVPRSHRHGALPTQENRGRLGRLYTDMERFQGEEPVPIEAPAGSVIYFHGDVVHGSRSNTSDASRRAIVLTYQPAGHPRWRHESIRNLSHPDSPS
jgi:hypothetical protein